MTNRLRSIEKVPAHAHSRLVESPSNESLRVLRMKILYLTLAAMVLASPTLQVGTLAQHRFDNDPSATVAKDKTGVNNGAITGGTHSASISQNPAKQTGAANAQSLSLSGTGQYVTVPNNPSFGASAGRSRPKSTSTRSPAPLHPGSILLRRKIWPATIPPTMHFSSPSLRAWGWRPSRPVVASSRPDVAKRLKPLNYRI